MLGAIREHTFAEGVRLTTSIGLAACPLHASNPAELVRKADQALYRAKDRGRDRAEVWEADLGAVAPRKDRLAGIITGNFARDYNNVSLLVETFDAISRTQEVREVLTLAVDKAIEASDAERGAIMLTDDRGPSPRSSPAGGTGPASSSASGSAARSPSGSSVTASRSTW